MTELTSAAALLPAAVVHWLGGLLRALALVAVARAALGPRARDWLGA